MNEKITLAIAMLFCQIALAQSPYLVNDLNPTVVPSLKYTDNLIDYNGTLIFTNEQSVYKSDGSSAGTVMVKFNYSSNTPKDFTLVGNTLYFTDWNTGGLSGRELWKTDGTTAGTVLVKDINPVQYQGSEISDLVAVNGILFFWANDGINGLELWKSDGTDAGTVMVKDIYQGTTYVNVRPTGYAASNNMLFFSAITDSTGTELWKSDGTEIGTVLVKEIRLGFNPNGLGYGSNPINFRDVNGTLFFIADDSTHGQELWKSDGTDAGTVLVKDINPMLGAGIPVSNNLTNINGTLYFEGMDGNGGELWKSDGTTSGTVLIKDITPGPFGHCHDFTNVNGTLFFVSAYNSYEQLWKSDGTLAGTVLVKEVRQNFGSAFSYYDTNYLTSVGTTLYFPADDGLTGVELWKSDGTDAGTTQVMDIDPTNSNNGSHPAHLTKVGGNLFFSAFSPNSGVELWAFDFATGLRSTLSIIKTIAYPNPTTGSVTFSFPGKINLFSQNVIIKISDLTGKVVKATSVNADQLSVDCSLFENGFYQYTLESENIFSSGSFTVLN